MPGSAGAASRRLISTWATSPICFRRSSARASSVRHRARGLGRVAPTSRRPSRSRSPRPFAARRCTFRCRSQSPASAARARAPSPARHPSHARPAAAQGASSRSRRASSASSFAPRRARVVDGAGRIVEKPCERCDGDGRLVEERTLDVDVPAGIHDGQRIRIRGEGHAGGAGGQAGDAFVQVRVRPDDRLARDGDDLVTVVGLTMVDAAIGSTVVGSDSRGRDRARDPVRSPAG